MRDIILAILFWSILGMSVFVFAYPWRMKSRFSRIFIHLPLLVLVLLVTYEWVMPAEMNIRVDLLVLLPVFWLAFICYLVRLMLIKTRRTREKKAVQ
jgi:hypothetical protein